MVELRLGLQRGRSKGVKAIVFQQKKGVVIRLNESYKSKTTTNQATDFPGLIREYSKGN